MATGDVQRFLKIFLPIAVVLAVIGAWWIKGHSSKGRDGELAKERLLQFRRVDSAEEAMVQLEMCLMIYGLAHEDVYPVGLEAVGPEGNKCTFAALTDITSGLKYRFVYAATAEDAKGKARGFTLQAYPLYTGDGQMAPEGTAAEYFASENGVVLVKKDYGKATERIEPLQGLPKTIQVLSAKLVAGSHLPADQQEMLATLGPEGSPGFSSVPKGYRGLWEPEDDTAAAVWTNLGEGYLYSYRPEHGSAPAHFTLVARPIRMGLPGEAALSPMRRYFLNETGTVRVAIVDREPDAKDPEISSCERTAEDCDRLWASGASGKP